MVGRYVFSVCSCVLGDLHQKGIDYETLSSSYYSDLWKIEFFSHEVCRSTTERCSCVNGENLITACNECFDSYESFFLCDSIKICIGKSFIKGRYRKCVIFDKIKFKEFAFS